MAIDRSKLSAIFEFSKNINDSMVDTTAAKKFFDDQVEAEKQAIYNGRAREGYKYLKEYYYGL